MAWYTEVLSDLKSLFLLNSRVSSLEKENSELQEKIKNLEKKVSEQQSHKTTPSCVMEFYQNDWEDNQNATKRVKSFCFAVAFERVLAIEKQTVESGTAT